jgi:signal transduction histidine kinase
MGGDVRADNRPGGGARFTIILPTDEPIAVEETS